MTAQHFEFIAAIYLGIIIAAPIALLTTLFTRFLDDAMDYGGIFWKLRFNLALRYASEDDIQILFNYKKEADRAPYDDQAPIMIEAYKEIARRNFKFIRWICRMCLGIFLSLFPTILGAITLFILGFPPLIILFYICSVPLLVYWWV